MYPRTNYEMSEADLKSILDACKPVPYIVIGGHPPSSPQENANRAWQELGKRMGFDYMSVEPRHDLGRRFFTAVPSETEAQRSERVSRENEAKREKEIVELRNEIFAKTALLKALEEKNSQLKLANDRPTQSNS